ncbi:Predicted ATPase [Mucilaginibacter lappiensis]|uniref:ATPase n=1 Tax=Mucilaginibacter lappiensis TaxID=354630 RepID=A0ABR6PLN3_9SPHI|nr:AAA family ATPase [Mucilaginibacter lappiensis]MBB6110129.1 putative ATPase [Mucilaginibacter lappiensis]SIR52272.1 Predicted ATPase [Mucilaginibacter lappiensis]
MEAKPYLQQISLKRESVPSFDVYPFHIPAVKEMSSMVFHPDVTFIIGENGSGKSTLIEAIALHLGFGIEGGSKNMQTKTHQNASVLFDYLTSSKSYRKPSDYFFLRAESFYNVATYLEEVDKGKIQQNYGVSSLHECSHGESFMATLTHRLSGNGLYIFDEPEAALSPARQLAALSAIHELVQANSQFIIATHSPILLAYPNAVIYQLDEEGMRKVKYDETEHFMLTKYFLNNHEDMTRLLMGDSLNLS